MMSAEDRFKIMTLITIITNHFELCHVRYDFGFDTRIVRMNLTIT